MIRILAWALALYLNAPEEREMSERLVPPGWQGNYYGPEATEARQEGRIPPIVMTTETTWYTIVAVAVSSRRPRAAYARAKAWIDRLAGLVLGGLGLRLLVEAGSVG